MERFKKLNTFSERVCVFLQLMSEFVLSAWLCLLIDWILLKDPGTATLNQQQDPQLTLSESKIDIDIPTTS